MNTTDYTKFDFEDFAQDEYFRKWVIDRDVQAEKFWNAWLIENPMYVDKVQLARAFLYALEEKDTSLDKASLEMITDEVAGQSIQLKPFWQRTFWRVAASILFSWHWVGGIRYLLILQCLKNNWKLLRYFQIQITILLKNAI